MSKSSSSYDAQKDSGFIQLPSERLLYDNSHVIKACVGFKSGKVVVELLKVDVGP